MFCIFDEDEMHGMGVSGDVHTGRILEESRNAGEAFRGMVSWT